MGIGIGGATGGGFVVISRGNYAWDEPTSYLAISPHSDANWLGADVHLSKDGGSTYVKIGSQAEFTPLGITRAVLPGTGVLAGVWDDASALDVEVFGDHVPTTRTKGEVLINRLNRIAVFTGANTMEVVAFATALDISDANDDRQYRLSNLLRGLRDTASEMGNHATGSSAVFLEPNALFPIQWELPDTGIAYQIKVVAPGEDIADVLAQDFTPDRRSLRPFTPTNLQGSISGTTLTLTWDYVTRSPTAKGLGSADLRFLERKDGPSDSYDFEVVVTDSAGSPAVTTYSAISVTLAQMQSAGKTHDTTGETSPWTCTVACRSEIYDGTPPATAGVVVS